MAKAKNKTQPTEVDPRDFLATVAHDKRREDSLRVLQLMEALTGEKARMWGGSIVGFGEYHYKYESGREGDMPKVGFSPRKTILTLYIMPGFERRPELMEQLGKYKTGKSCLYVNKLEDVEEEVLKELIQYSYDYMTEKYG
ncbi:MAG: DUF1801 domain-containing protein [Bacteroidota bacterium]